MNNRFKFNDKYYKTEIARKSKNGKTIKGYYLCGGYLKVKVKEHPAQDKRGYVLFHRLVMEDNLNRYLLEDEYIHHKDGNKLNNNIENLELMYGNEHAKEHCNNRARNGFGQFICSDKHLNNIKIRLFNKDRGDVKEYSLSKLTYTTFKRNCFEYRGMSTGLKDKNGKLIYEADIIDKGTRCKWIITWFKNRFILVPDFEYKNKDKCASDRECGFKYFENNHSYADEDIEVIGNIYQDSHLLEN